MASDGSEVRKVFTTSFYQGPERLHGWTKLPLVVRIVTRIAFASVTERANALWVPLCADWQTVDPKVVIRAASQFKVNKSGLSTVMPLP